MRQIAVFVAAVLGFALTSALHGQPAKPAAGVGDYTNHPVNVWVKQSPSEGWPPAPRPFQYEGCAVYDPQSKKVFHHAGHEGIYQTERTFAFDLESGQWRQCFPGTSPAGSCCQNNNGQAFDIANSRLVRFEAGSLGHGFQLSRSVYLKQAPTSVWAFDPAGNAWTAMRPAPYGGRGKGSSDWDIGGLCHGSTYDPLHEVVVHLPNNSNSTIIYTYDVYENVLDMFKADGDAPKPPRGAAGLAYDPKNARVVAFGSPNADPKTWLFDYTTRKWTGLDLDPHPPVAKEGQYSTHPVMACDSRNNVMLCVIWHPSTGEHETWALELGATPKWTKTAPPAEPDPGASRARNIAYSAEHNVFILELAPKSGPNQIWTYRYRDPGADKSPKPATGLEVQAEPGKAALAWAASATGGVKEYRVLRAEAQRAWQTEYKQIGATDKLTFTDSTMPAGKTCFYKVVAVGADGQQSQPSVSARTQPRAPAAPVVSVLAKDKVEISWKKHPARDVVGYNVYRGLASVKAVTKGEPAPWRDNDPEYPEPRVCRVNSITGIVKLNDAPLADTSFTDAKVDLTAKPAESGDYKYAVYAYIVRAVNKLGIESGPSPYALTIPSAPTNVLVRNAGRDGWEMKWDPSVEKGVVGYRVYVTKGQHSHEPLTPFAHPPVKEPRFAGSGGLRLWVTATDALGQEGEPSSPANVNPTYKGFFEGEWHQ